MPWQLKLVTLGVTLVIGFTAGWTINGWRLHSKIAALEASYAQAVAEAYKRTQEAQNRLSTQSEASRKAHQNEIKSIRSQYERTINSLRDRPDRRADLPAVAASCAGVSGKELSSRDGEFLAGFAADAAQLQSALKQCETQYNAARDALK